MELLCFFVCFVWQLEVDAIVDEHGLLDLLSQIDQLVARSSGQIDADTSVHNKPASHSPVTRPSFTQAHTDHLLCFPLVVCVIVR